ncbi:hypothetical protein FEK35_07190 [Nocardia cyriacigeorgica]|uniref:WXG100 family type VII secretion target n=1 Tax=Nocardia cyriacigeorgica TaxID=135487 RepID=A0A5R8PIQ5_9NOCA|nr:hypothetical protein [Nocardia cyriacigeorgica]TLG14924.1 hypothetical protein FEK35_07190 [Nocardia cyriacigeorgica]
MSQPQEHLTEPQAEQPVSDEAAFLLGANFVSPSYALFGVIEKIIHVKIPDWLASQIGGDWEAVSRAANAAGNLAKFNTSYAESLTTNWQSILDDSWKGNAAASAKDYFAVLASSLNYQVGPLNTIDQELQKVANSMANLSRVLGDLVQILVDDAIIWSIEALVALGPNPDPTGASRAAALAAMAVTAVAMAKTFLHMVGKVTAVYDSFVAIWALLEHQVRGAGPEKLPTLGEKAYNHPGVS